MKRKIHIDFCDLGWNHTKTGHYLFRVLSERFDLELCDQPDFLIFDVHGHMHRLSTAVRVMFTTEHDYPDYRICDYSASAQYVNDPRHLHFPACIIRGPVERLLKQAGEAERILASKTKFCSFVVSHHNARKTKNRADFFKKLSRYKRVDSGGGLLNNIGGPLPHGAVAKAAFLRPYKFNIAYENASYPGYFTEKIYDAMAARCLPIYWGDPLIGQQFNPRSFLNRADFPSDEALIEKIIELDQDDEKYLAYTRQPFLPDNQPTPLFSHARILDFFERVFTTPIVPVARRRKGLPLGRWTTVKRNHGHCYPNLGRSDRFSDGLWADEGRPGEAGQQAPR